MLTSGIILCLQCQSSHVDVLYWTRQGAPSVQIVAVKALLPA